MVAHGWGLNSFEFFCFVTFFWGAWVRGGVGFFWGVGTWMRWLGLRWVFCGRDGEGWGGCLWEGDWGGEGGIVDGDEDGVLEERGMGWGGGIRGLGCGGLLWIGMRIWEVRVEMGVVRKTRVVARGRDSREKDVSMMALFCSA